LQAHVTEWYGSALATFTHEGPWRLTPQIRLSRLSDENRRFTAQADLSRELFRRRSLRAIYRFIYDDMKDVSPRYYSPQDLVEHHLGLEFSPRLQYVDPFIRYLPGYGKENGVDSGFIQQVEAGFPLKLGADTTVGPYFSYVRTPSYRRNSYSLVATHRF
jgi:hypothetical protein